MNKVKALLSNVSAAFTSLARQGVQRLSLVPTYLAHLLWLLSQEFAQLAKHAYGGNAAVYAVLRVLATSVAEPPLVAYSRQSNGEPGSPLPYAHPLCSLIRSPNPFMTEFEFWELATIQCAIGGISHWWKERSNSGQVLALWPLRPDRVGPIYGDAMAGEPVLLGWSYLMPGTTHYVGLPSSDVLTFNLPDPMGESGGLAEGFGPIQALASEISADNEATKYVGTLISNYATPGTVLEVAGKITSKADADLLKAGFMRQFGGRHRGEPAVVDNGTKITSLGFSLQQLEFKDLRKVSESRVAAAVGVPAILAGLLVGLEAGIKATIAEQREYFTETTLAAYWRRYADQYTKDIAAEYGAQYICRFDLTKVRALVQQTLQEYMKIQGAFERGAITINELRDELHFKRRPDGDVYAHGIAPGGGTEVLVSATEDLTDVSEVTPNGNEKPPANGKVTTPTPVVSAAGRSALPPPSESNGKNLLDHSLAALLDEVFAEPTL